MDRVNLIPKELRLGVGFKIVRFLRGFDVQIVIAAWVIFLLFMVSSLLGQAVKSSRLTRKIAREQQEIKIASAALNEVKESMKQYEQMKKILTYQAALITRRAYYLTAQKGRPYRWAGVLRELRRSLPQKVWLYDLSTEDNFLKISGGSFDSTLISDFMSNLRASKHFNNVEFVFTEKAKISETDIIKFEIKCQYLLEG